jgi:DNA-binding GntR family transcriptional regulator
VAEGVVRRDAVRQGQVLTQPIELGLTPSLDPDKGVGPTQHCQQCYRENLDEIMWGAAHARIPQVTKCIFQAQRLEFQKGILSRSLNYTVCLRIAVLRKVLFLKAHSCVCPALDAWCSFYKNKTSPDFICVISTYSCVYLKNWRRNVDSSQNILHTAARSNSYFPRSESTLWARIANAIRERILSKEWKSGEYIPSESAFAKHYSVSVGTAKAAVQALIEQGLLERVRGRGTCVRGVLGDALMTRFFRRHSTDVPESQILSVNSEVLSDKVAAKIGLAVSDSHYAIRMVRQRRWDGKVRLLETHWLPEALFSELKNMHPQDFPYAVHQRRPSERKQKEPEVWSCRLARIYRHLPG